MEQQPNFESAEQRIERLIEELASKEEMEADAIISDLITFLDIATEDPDAMAYFEETAEKLGISVEELTAYAQQKASE